MKYLAGAIVYASIKARYPAGLNLNQSQISNGVYVPLSFTVLKVVSLLVVDSLSY